MSTASDAPAVQSTDVAAPVASVAPAGPSLEESVAMLHHKLNKVLSFIATLETVIASARTMPGIPGTMLRNMLPGLDAMGGH